MKNQPEIDETIAQLKCRPDDAELYQKLGDLYFESVALTEAWNAYLQSFKLNPDDPFTCLKFGTLLMIADAQNARQLFDRAIDLSPNLSVVHWTSGSLHKKLGEYALADQAFMRAVEVEPDNEQAIEKLAEWKNFIEQLEISAQ